MGPPTTNSPLRDLVAATGTGDPSLVLAAAKRGYAAFLRGEMSLDDPAVDPDVEWIPPKHAPTAGAYRGAAAAEEEVQAWREPFDDFRWEPKEVLLGEGCFVVVGDMAGRGRTSGLEVQTEESHVWTLRDGRMVRMQMFLDRSEALAAAGLTPDA